jgi:Mg2+/Co2+ transporter CorB
MDWSLPEDEASTLNGLLLEELGEIPSGKASLRIGHHIMTILEIKDNVIGKVLVKPEAGTTAFSGRSKRPPPSIPTAPGKPRH